MITVEAALLAPGLLLCIIWILYMMLFLLDMSVVKSETRRIADEAAAVWKTDGSLVDGTYEENELLSRPMLFLLQGGRGEWKDRSASRGSRRIRGRLSIAKPGKMEVRLEKNRVKVCGTVQMNDPFSRAARQWGMGALSFTATSCRTIENWEEWLRAADCLAGNQQ